MFSLIKDGELLEKYSEIWETVKDSLKNSLIVNQNTKKKKYLTAKIKSYNPLEKSTQISGTIKKQKNIIEIFPYH